VPTVYGEGVTEFGGCFAGREAVSGGRDVILSGAVAPHNGLSLVVVFVLEGDFQLGAVGRHFAALDHEV
jgi:hypothetical protein